MALDGCVDEISRVRVFGWVTDAKRPRAAVKISVRVNGIEMVRGVANLFRRGLKEHLGGEATGSYEFDIKFPVSLSPFLGFEIEIVAEGYKEQLAGARRTLAAPSVGPGQFKPIILTSTGRSGTTMLMKELCQHPQVVAADRYPYEIKLISYYSAAFQALASNEDRINSTHPDEMFGAIPGRQIGHNPYFIHGLFSIAKDETDLRTFFEDTIPSRFADLFQTDITDYYEIIKDSSQKASASYFAEKGDLEEAAREGARLFFGSVREIVMVRDPRDMLCSAKAFWKQTSAEALKKLKKTLPRLEQIRDSAGADTLFIRYEDLISDPVSSRRTLARFVGIEDFPGIGTPALTPDAQFSSHATSADPLASIGRWKNELTDKEVRDCDRFFRSYMDAFGYSRHTTEYQRLRHIELFSGDDAVGRSRAETISIEGTILEPLFDASFAPKGNSARYLGTGWHKVEPGFVWTQGDNSLLQFDHLAVKGQYRLRLVGRPFTSGDRLPSQRMSVLVNGRFVGEATLTHFSVIECDLPKHLFSKSGSVSVALKCCDATRPCDMDSAVNDDRLLGFALERLQVFGGRALPKKRANVNSGNTRNLSVASEEISQGELMLRFESLGENCEFGLVQRRCGIDPLGLFRFSSTPLPKLLDALHANFEGMGKTGNIGIQVSSNGREYMVEDKRFGFLYHAWVLVEEKTADETLKREIRRLPLLIRKLVEELTTGDKIFVFHGMEPHSLEQARALLAALRTYGPGTLLWVELADKNHAPGTVEQIEPGLLKGRMDRFAPGENAHDLSLKCWVDMCRNAYRLWRAEA